MMRWRRKETHAQVNLKMYIEEFLSKLVEEFRLDQNVEKADLGYRLTLPPQTEVIFSELFPGIFISADLVEKPADRNQEDLLIYLMKANLLEQGTGASAIGLSNDKEVFCLSLSHPFDLDYRLFKSKLEEFINYLNYWNKEIHRFKLRKTRSPFG